MFGSRLNVLSLTALYRKVLTKNTFKNKMAATVKTSYNSNNDDDDNNNNDNDNNNSNSRK